MSQTTQLTHKQYADLCETFYLRIGKVCDDFLAECKSNNIQHEAIPSIVLNAYVNIICVYIDCMGAGDKGKHGLISIVMHTIYEYFANAKIIREQQQAEASH